MQIKIFDKKPRNRKRRFFNASFLEVFKTQQDLEDNAEEQEIKSQKFQAPIYGSREKIYTNKAFDSLILK